MRTQRLIIPVVAGIAVFGTVSAFAASISLGSQTLGAGDAVVEACDAATPVIAANYTTVFAAGRYVVTEVILTSPVACAGKAVKVTLTGTSGVLIEKPGTMAPAPATSTTLTLATPVSAAEVTGISAVIAG